MKFSKITSHFWSLLILLIIGALPLAFSNVRGKVDFHLTRIPEEITRFFAGIFDGSSFYFMETVREQFFFHAVGKFFAISFIYLATAGFFVVLLSIIFGIWMWRKTDRGLNSYVGFIGMIPDFVFVLLLQLLVIYIFQTTGIRIARVATFNMNDPAIALPLIILFVIPFIYLVKSLSEKTYDVLTESYIRTARAKGFNYRQIYLYHVTTNVIPFLKADLHKVTSIMIGNLFIVEFLFNLKGLTSMLFPINTGYQYNLFILCFLSFFVLYIAIFMFLKIVVLIIERVLSHERAI